MIEKLNEILSREKVIKSRTDKTQTEIHQNLQKPALFIGFSKTYKPAKETEADGSPAQVYPPEVKNVESKVDELLDKSYNSLKELFNITWKKDALNCVATADVVLDNGDTLIQKVPVTHLLWLEKQLTLLKSTFEKLPVLPPADSWTWEDAKGLYASPPNVRARTEKTQRPVVVVPPTDKHPAQVQILQEEKTTGYWTHVELSGALTPEQAKGYVNRLDNLLAAVKAARARANTTGATPFECTSEIVLDYLFNKK